MKEAYDSILARIEAARVAAQRRSPVVLIAVSKTQPADAIEALYRLGQRDFGENYVQELLEKSTELRARGCTEIRWHFIGHLQTNKVKSLVSEVAAIHSVDSEKVAREISKRREALGKSVPALAVFIEVNIDREASKAGVMPEGAKELATSVASLPGLSLMGLMAVPEPGIGASRAFAELASLEQSCQPSTRGFLSMGMSGDFAAAIAAGATHVRVGTALFGERKRAT